MLLRECSGSAVESRLRMVEQLDGNGLHSLPEPALCDETPGKAARRQTVLEPITQSAGDHDRIRSMGERKVSRHRPERQEKAVKRGNGQWIGPIECCIPDNLALQK